MVARELMVEPGGQLAGAIEEGEGEGSCIWVKITTVSILTYK